jgi:hypothetical protein
MAILVQLDEIDILPSSAEGFGVAGDGVAAIGGLNEGWFAGGLIFCADGFGPLEVSSGIQFDDLDIPISCAEGFGVAGDGVAAIGGLNEGVAPIIVLSADSLYRSGRRVRWRGWYQREGSFGCTHFALAA